MTDKTPTRAEVEDVTARLEKAISFGLCGPATSNAEEAASALRSLLARVEELEKALTESVKLQGHYSELLNMHDGGKRHAFSSADEWIARLNEISP